MRLIPFLLISFLIHALVLLSLQLPLHIKKKLDHNNQFLQVFIANKQLPPNPGFYAAKNKMVNAEQVSPVEALNKSRILDDLSPHKINSHLVSNAIVTNNINDSIESVNDSQTTVDYSNYYATADVDRKALPQINIDDSKIKSDTYSGLPIKLRLYISANGRLVKTEPIGLLDQDRDYAAQLEKLLMDLIFLPARKDNLDVDSYQDLQFSFNPQPMAGNPTDLN